MKKSYLIILSLFANIFFSYLFLNTKNEFALGILLGCSGFTTMNFIINYYEKINLNSYNESLILRSAMLDEYQKTIEDKSKILNDITVSNLLFMKEIEASYKKQGIDITTSKFKPLVDALEFSYLASIKLEDLGYDENITINKI